MRLTADLIERSAAFTNALGERELDMRSKTVTLWYLSLYLYVDNKIPAIENLIITKDVFDTIDLTGNEIKRLDNFPRLNRLSTLLLSNNSISRIDTELFSPAQLPRLHTLVLTGNRLLDLPDLQPLSVFSGQLKHLSLLDNPVIKKPHYRLFVISLLSGLRTLDFRRVRPQEVKEAHKMFGGSGAAGEAKVFEPGQVDGTNEEAEGEQEPSTKRTKLSGGSLTPEQVSKIQAAIKAAKTLAEINRLEKILQTGHIPDDKELKYLQL